MASNVYQIECTLGIDLGTSGVKVALVDLDGHPVGFESEPYAYASPQPGWAEIDPFIWEAAAIRAVKALLARAPQCRVVGVGLDGQMHGLVLVDDAEQPVMPAMLWPDERARHLVSSWPEIVSADVLASLRNPLSAGMAGPLLQWVYQTRPSLARRLKRALSPKDWLRSRLVAGSVITDPSDASATLLWDVDANGWNLRLMDKLGLDPNILPEVRNSTEVAGHTDKITGPRWGLPTGVPVTVGCADVAATMLAVENVHATTTLVLGSGAQAVALGAGPGKLRVPVSFHTYRSADERYYAMVATTNAGLALSRVCGMLGLSWGELYATSFTELGPDDPAFLPFFASERLPQYIPAARASWRNIPATASRATLAASAVEGVLLSVCRAVAALPVDDGVIQMVGGGAKEGRVRQFLADVLNRPVLTRQMNDATVIGAARLALKMIGVTPGTAEEDLELLQPKVDRETRRRNFDDMLSGLLAEEGVRRVGGPG